MIQKEQKAQLSDTTADAMKLKSRQEIIFPHLKVKIFLFHFCIYIRRP